MLTKEPLFTGKGEIDQLDKIFKTLGTPNETIWPGLSKLPGAKANFVKQPYNQLRKKFPFTPFTGSPVLSDSGFDLLNRLLTFNPEKRITADDALNHPWFNEVPLSKSKEFMPTFPPQYAKNRPNQRTMKCLDSRSSGEGRQYQLLKAFSIKCKKKKSNMGGCFLCLNRLCGKVPLALISTTFSHVWRNIPSSIAPSIPACSCAWELKGYSSV
ncbi:hypothetical protein OIU76_000454 [Salix suchowensis]|nr:hypothetical protein OIU76_000454 [Salix suchowensis]